MKQHHGWSPSELEEMVPFERQIYVDLLLKFLKEQKEKDRRR